MKKNRETRSFSHPDNSQHTTRESKNCILCDCEMESAMPMEGNDPWATMQPYAGGTMELLFCYGSTKFDRCVGTTTFKAIICDDCATPLVKKIEESNG